MIKNNIYDKIYKVFNIINFFMERIFLENRIKKIISFIKNQDLGLFLETNISVFEDDDLERLLEFLETGSDELIADFLTEKTKEFMLQVEKIKQIKSKIKKEKLKKQETQEKTEEENELENLLDF
ncbi:hypothetical protein DLH72_03960 [Candidatus Gracilibacteria bacterium]|nr:MAG: hypothetical protein DLH72_03960 [Candidatus Gracilibacteria bacterium]